MTTATHTSSLPSVLTLCAVTVLRYQPFLATGRALSPLFGAALTDSEEKEFTRRVAAMAANERPKQVCPND